METWIDVDHSKADKERRVAFYIVGTALTVLVVLSGTFLFTASLSSFDEVFEGGNKVSLWVGRGEVDH